MGRWQHVPTVLKRKRSGVWTMEKQYPASAATIRLENIGCVIWSPQRRRYFQLAPQYQERFTQGILQGLSISAVLNSVPDIRSDLLALGVDDTAQIVNHISGKNRSLYAPLECYFDYTEQCNLRCTGCYNINTWGNTCMSIPVIKKILGEMYELGIRRTYLAGGEPVTNEAALQAYFDTCFDLGITSSIATNGTLLSEEICEYLLSRGLFDISVSIDGWDDASSIRLRGRERFDDAVSGVKRLVRCKQKLRSKTEICIKPIIDRQLDVEFYENMIRLAIDLKVDKLKLINPERSVNHPRGYYGIQVDRYYKMNATITALQKKYQNVLTITSGSNPCNGFGHIGIKGIHGCIGGQELLAINPNGRISPCLMDQLPLGNYYAYGSLKSFLDSSEVLKQFRAAKSIDDCSSCSIYSRCRGGCHVRKIVQTGTRSGSDPVCPVRNNIPMNPDVRNDSEALRMIICGHSL